MSKTCRECGAKCCQYFCFEIDVPEDFGEFEDLRWFLLHEGISVHIDEGDWYISIANRCKALAPDGRCRIYADRPLICRKYSMDNCDHTGGDYEYDRVFHTPEEMEACAREVLGDRAYERARGRAYARTERPAGAKPKAARSRPAGRKGR